MSDPINSDPSITVPASVLSQLVTDRVSRELAKRDEETKSQGIKPSCANGLSPGLAAFASGIVLPK